MSTAVVSTSAALGRHFVFDEEAVPEPRPFSISDYELPLDAEDDLRNVYSDQSTINNQQSTISPPTFGNRKSEIGNSLRTLDSFIAIDPRLAGVTPASRLSVRPAPEMVSSGIAAIDELTGGLPRGCLTEICGPASSGRTALLLAALSAATQRGEFCALVDASDALDPQSAAAAGVQLDRLLWVRCSESSLQKHSSTKQKFGSKRNEGRNNEGRNAENRLEQVLRVTDLLLESGGFGLVALDLADLPSQQARRIPLATWFRFRRAVEPTSTVLLTLEQQPIAGSCSSLVMKLGSENELLPTLISVTDESAAERRKNAAHGASRGSESENEKAPKGRKKNCINEQSLLEPQYPVPSHAQLLEQIEIKAELMRSRLERKPANSAFVAFSSRTSWTDEKTG
jgi:hypothetical protein